MKRRILSVVGGAALMLLGSFTSVEAAGAAQQPTICNRSCWNARAPQSGISYMSGLNRAIVHHTASSGDYNTTSLNASKAIVRSHQNYHMDSNGWTDIGYHFLTDKLGNIFEGRYGSLSSLPRGAHDKINSNSFAYCMMGYFHSPYNHQPTSAHRNAMYDVIAWRMPNGYSSYGSGSYGGGTVGYLDGHRSVPTNSTSCPGDIVFNNYITSNYNSGAFRNEIDARINPTTEEGVVDNDDGGSAYSETGSWFTSGSTGYNNGTYRYATVGASATATWTANLPDPGNYKVSVIYRSGSNRATSAKYVVAGQNKFVNQTQNDLSWVSLGTFTFGAGNATVKLDAGGSSGNSVVIADAVKFEYVSPITVIVDNGGSNFTASSSWFSSTYTSGYYGSNYQWRSTEAISDAAAWNVNLPASGSYKVYARWTAGSNRASSAPYIIYHNGGSSTVHVNQQANNGTWVSLGTYNFNSGASDKVILSCWTTSGDVVVADAVRFISQ